MTIGYACPTPRSAHALSPAVTGCPDILSAASVMSAAQHPAGEPIAGASPRAAPAPLRELIEVTVADVFHVDLDELRRPTRGRARAALARQVAMYIAHTACGLSLTEVGRLFERDRTTAAHACKLVEHQREDDQFDKAVDLLALIVRVLMGTQVARTRSTETRSTEN